MNTAFSENPVARCAVGVDGSVLSVVVRQQDLDSMPGQTPALTPGGRPTLKNLTKRERGGPWLAELRAWPARVSGVIEQRGYALRGFPAEEGLQVLRRAGCGGAAAQEQSLFVGGERELDVGLPDQLGGQVRAVVHGEVRALAGEGGHQVRGVAEERGSGDPVPFEPDGEGVDGAEPRFRFALRQEGGEQR